MLLLEGEGDLFCFFLGMVELLGVMETGIFGVFLVIRGGPGVPIIVYVWVSLLDGLSIDVGNVGDSVDFFVLERVVCDV